MLCRCEPKRNTYPERDRRNLLSNIATERGGDNKTGDPGHVRTPRLSQYL